MKLAKPCLVLLAAAVATSSLGCYGRHGRGALLATAFVASTVAMAIDEHAELERARAIERERDEAPVYPRVYVIDAHGVLLPAGAVIANAPPPAIPAAPAIPPPPPFDARRARTSLGGVDLAECRAAGAPRGYGHAKATVNPSGDISKVVVDEPSGLSPAAAKCVGDALGRVTVPEFSGSYVTVGTTWFVP